MVSELRQRTDKPHIFFENGYWRVTPASKGVVRKGYTLWNRAHNFIQVWNSTDSSFRRLRMAWATAPAICECTEVDYCENCLRKMSHDNNSGSNENTLSS